MYGGVAAFMAAVGSVVGSRSLPIVVGEIGVSNGKNFATSDYAFVSTFSTQAIRWVLARQAFKDAVALCPTLAAFVAYDMKTTTQTSNGTATNSSGHSVILTDPYALFDNALVPFAAAPLALTFNASKGVSMTAPLIPSPNTTLAATTNTSIPFTARIYEWQMFNYNTAVGLYFEEDSPAGPGSAYMPPAVSAAQPSIVTHRVMNLGALNIYPTGAGLILNNSSAITPPTGLVLRGYTP
jgi:hypothetical protein